MTAFWTLFYAFGLSLFKTFERCLSDGSLMYCVLFCLFLMYPVFCDELDTTDHHLQHKRSRVCIIEGVDDRELVEPDVLVEDTKGQKAHFYSREFGMHLKQF